MKDLEREKIEHEAALQTMADAEAAAKLKAEEERAELAARNIDISLPKELIGSIIGKKGANIHDIMKRTGTNITVHSDIGRWIAAMNGMVVYSLSVYSAGSHQWTFS